jgi:U1 small nuclear ribonucleoprotein
LLTLWTTDKPQEDPKIKGDAFKTLFVARLNYDVDEKDLQREFGRFGPIERVRIRVICLCVAANCIPDTYRHERPRGRERYEEEEAHWIRVHRV